MIEFYYIKLRLNKAVFIYIVYIHIYVCIYIYMYVYVYEMNDSHVSFLPSLTPNSLEQAHGLEKEI